MTRTKNRICYVSPSLIVPQGSTSSNILSELSDANLQQVVSSPYLQYDFEVSGMLRLGLPNGVKLVFDTDALGTEAVESLIVACLNHKTVVGCNLYTSYTMSHLLTENWKPRCTLNIPTLKRTFQHSKALIKGSTAIEQLISMTNTKSFNAAVEKIVAWDESNKHTYFTVCELMPQTVARLCCRSIREVVAKKSERLNIEVYLKASFSANKAVLTSPEEVTLLEFNPDSLSRAICEFEVAVESLSDILGPALHIREQTTFFTTSYSFHFSILTRFTGLKARRFELMNHGSKQ